MTERPSPRERDFLGHRLGYVLAWGLPIGAMVLAVPLAPPLKSIVWTLALVWMGAACLANAARCGRMHCYVTGPFFLVIAGVSALHGLGIVSFGPAGWLWLGLTLGVGTAVLWWLPERLWGKYARQRRETPRP